jgi:hypothetical protein
MKPPVVRMANQEYMHNKDIELIKSGMLSSLARPAMTRPGRSLFRQFSTNRQFSTA